MRSLTSHRQPAVDTYSMSMPSRWATFWQSVFRFQANKISPWMALRNTLGVVIPLAAGAGFGEVSTGIAAATGALNVCFSDSDEPYVLRANRMLAASFIIGFAVFIGSLSGGNQVMAVLTATGWAFSAGILVALSSTAADLGVISLVTLVVYAAVPMPAEKAGLAGVLALAGGLFQTGLAVALRPLRRFVPERRVLGQLYRELSRAAASPHLASLDATQSPPATAESIQAHSSLAALARDSSVEAERYRLLLSQAERMRLSLLMLARLRTRIERDNPASPEGAIIDRYFEICSGLLRPVGDSLIAGQPADAPAERMQELQSLAEHLREPSAAQPEDAVPWISAVKKEARYQMDALAGQLRAAIDLAASATPAGLSAFQRREARKPWSLRLGGTIATLRANLSLNAAACRHAVRLAACVAMGDALARGFELRRSYWLPMTIAIVLKPDFTATFSRGVLRLAGTFAGLVVATALFHSLPAAIGVEVALISVLMFAMRCFGPANYGIVATSVTALVVILIAMTGVSPKEVIAARGLNTVLGGIITLLAYWLWPTWERTQVPEAMAQMLDAYRRHFRAIRESYEKPDVKFAEELDHARVAARLGRTNLRASIDRSFYRRAGHFRGAGEHTRCDSGEFPPPGARLDGSRSRPLDEPSGARARNISALRQRCGVDSVLSGRRTAGLPVDPGIAPRPAGRSPRSGPLQRFRRRALRTGERRNRPLDEQPEHAPRRSDEVARVAVYGSPPTGL